MGYRISAAAVLAAITITGTAAGAEPRKVFLPVAKARAAITADLAARRQPGDPTYTLNGCTRVSPVVVVCQLQFPQWCTETDPDPEVTPCELLTDAIARIKRGRVRVRLAWFDE